MERNAWYQLRDDRTKRIDGVSGFEDFSLGVIINSQIAVSYPIQVMTLTILNILARWCRKLRILLPPNSRSCLPGQEGQNLREILAEQVAAIDPYVQFSFCDQPHGDCNEILFIGQPEELKELDERSIWIDGSGWIAGVGCGVPAMNLPLEDNDNPVGPAFASCLGAAEVFRRAIGLPPSQPEASWHSLYDYHKVDNPSEGVNPKYVSDFDFGRIHQVGCGAVASSLDFLVSLTNWRGELHLIDYDQVDVTNCNRSLAFSAYDAVKARNKTDSCADLLKRNVHPVSFKGTYADFIKQGKFIDLPADIILCLANERNVWADIQNNLPPIVFHATTTPNWAINFGRHIPKKEWCIMCRFARQIEYAFTPNCSEGEIKPEKADEKPIQGVLPFSSPSAAVLILAEMAKMPLANYPVNEDFVEFSMKKPGLDFLTFQRGAEEGCMCNEQSTDLYPIEVKTSRFWRLSSDY
jgi:hypothetical protein